MDLQSLLACWYLQLWDQSVSKGDFFVCFLSVLMYIKLHSLLTLTVALTFGTTVKMKPLMIKGARNELLSLFLCFIVGAVVMILCALCKS